MKLLQIAGNLLGIGKGKSPDGGIASIIKEKTGKISFRRSIGIVVITTIVAPVVLSTNIITWPIALLTLVCVASTCVNINIGK